MRDPDGLDDRQDHRPLDHVAREVRLPRVIRLDVEVGDVAVPVAEVCRELGEYGAVPGWRRGWRLLGGERIDRHDKLRGLWIHTRRFESRVGRSWGGVGEEGYGQRKGGATSAFSRGLEASTRRRRAAVTRQSTIRERWYGTEETQRSRWIEPRGSADRWRGVER